MSVKVTSLVLDHFPLGGGIYALAFTLADRAGHDGSGIYYSVETMAFLSRQGERAVRYQLRHLEEIGWLECVERSTGGSGKTTTYRMPIERIPQGIVGTRHLLPRLEVSTAGDVKNDVSHGTVQNDATGQMTTPNGANGSGNGAYDDINGAPHAPNTLKTQDHPTAETQKAGASRPSSIPDDFSISDPIRAWAEEKGYTPYLQAHFEYFTDYARSRKAKVKYSDWDAAFRNCVRSDWGKVRAEMIKRGVVAKPALVCRETVSPGEECGMTGAVACPDGVPRCKHHREKRAEKVATATGPVPEHMRAALQDALKRKPTAVTP